MELTGQNNITSQPIQLPVLNMQGLAVGTILANATLFGRPYNEALVHQVVTAYLANARQGTCQQKTRAEVTCSTKKPWRQKGTGRARAGAASSPLWRGGGRIFPNLPTENFSHKVNRKMYRAAMATILSKLLSDERLKIIDDFTLTSPKTKLLVNTLAMMGLSYQDNLLIVVSELPDNLYYASRNLPTVLIIEAQQIDPYNLLRFKQIIMTQQAVEQLQEHWIC